ncbi:hypothetical protein QFC24_004852 [Naganishia onofrii]|uniref:Uncharacterized protein n=1 Tax=Naganishia onofrii TaxID=1851511 RepID=A0ACC2XAY2_9TREE|nr:hypothetical protein QFC24_004852 [Naganishia onofrii]
MNPGGQIPPVPGHTYHSHQPGMFTHVQQAQQQQVQQPGQVQGQGQANPQLQRTVSGMQMAQAQPSHQKQPGPDGQSQQQYMMNGNTMTPMQKVQGGAVPMMGGMVVAPTGSMPLPQPSQQALREFEMQQQFQREQQQRQQLQLQHQAQAQGQAQMQSQPGQSAQDGALMQAQLQQRMAIARQMQQQANAQGQQRIMINTAMPLQATAEGPNGNSAISAGGPNQRPNPQLGQSGSQPQMTQQMQSSGSAQMNQHGQQRQSVPPPTPQTANNHSATQTPQLAHLPNLPSGQGQAGQNGQFPVGMTPRRTTASQGNQSTLLPVNGWDGDVMLHLYIHDYLVKRQFTEAAAALRTEAALGDQIVVPIDCPQGLLYEWWAVFWDVFSTNNGKPQPSPEAIQFMNVQLRQKLTQHQQMGLGRPSQQMTPQMAHLFRQQQKQNALRSGQQVMGYQQMNGVTGQMMEMTPEARQQLQQQQQQLHQHRQHQMQLQQQQQGQQAQAQMQGQAGQAMRPMTSTANSVAGVPPLPPGSTMVLGPGMQGQAGNQQMQQQHMMAVNQQAQNVMAQNANRSGGLMVTGLPISRQASLPVGTEATHHQFLPPGVMSNQMLEGVRSETPQISVQTVSVSPQMGGFQHPNATPGPQQVEVSPASAQVQQRAHLAVQQQTAQAQQQQQMQQMHGQMMQQRSAQQTQQHPGAQNEGHQLTPGHSQKAAVDMQTIAATLGIVNIQPQALNSALWATGLLNRHPDGWNGAEKDRLIDSYNVTLENMRKAASQPPGQQGFGDPNALGFQRPQSMVPASPINAPSQGNMAMRMNNMPQLTPQQQHLYLQQMSQHTRPMEDEPSDSPPNKRMRRNSGSAGASPFSHTVETPQTLATPHLQQTPASTTMALNYQMALQAQAQQLSATQAQAHATYIQNIQQQQHQQQQQQQQQHQQQQQQQQQQQHMQRQQMMLQHLQQNSSHSDVRAYQQRIAEQQRQSMRAVAANAQGTQPTHGAQVSNSPLSQTNEGDGEGGAATPAFEAQIHNTSGSPQLSLDALHRTQSSRSISTLAQNVQQSPSTMEFVAPQTASLAQPPASSRNGGSTQASPGVIQSSESAALGAGKTPSPTAVNYSTDSVVELPISVGPPGRKQGMHVRNSKETASQQNPVGPGQPLPSPSDQQRVETGATDAKHANASSSESLAKPEDQVTAAVNPEQTTNPDINPEDADTGVDFSHLLGNDLFNNMHGGEEGEGYDINFAGFNMDADIFEIYMNDGYEGGPQTSEGA